MAASNQALKLKIDAEDNATPKLRLLKTQVDDLNKGFKLLNPSILGVGVGMTAMVGFVGKAIQEFSAYELTVKKLGVAIKNQGVQGEEYLTILTQTADELERLTGVNDDQILSAQKLLVTFGVLGTNLEKATKAALDLAAAQGIDLESAASAVGKAFQGNTRALQQMGVKVDETIPKGEKFAAAMKLINDTMGGQAEAQTGTVVGAFTAAKNALGDFLKEVGRGISETGLLQKALKGLADFISPVGAKDQRQKDIKNLEESIAKMESKDLSKAPKSTVEFYEKSLASLKDRLKWLNSLNEREKQVLETVQEQAVVNEKAKKAQQDALKMAETWEKLNKSLQDDKIDLLGKARIENHIAVKQLNELNELDQERIYKLQEQANLLKAEREEMEKMAKTAGLDFAQGFVTANAGQMAKSAAVSSGLASSPAEVQLVGLAIDLVANAEKLPDQIQGTMDGLLRGLSEGLPKLIEYLSNDFLPNLLTGLAKAIGSLVKGLPGLLGNWIKGSLNLFTGGLFGALGGLFDDSPEEKLAKVIDKLADAINQLHGDLTQKALGLLASSGDISAQRRMIGFQDVRNRREFSGLVEDFEKAGRKGDTEKAAQIAKDIERSLAEQMDIVKARYDLEIRKLDELVSKRKEDLDIQIKAQEEIRAAAEQTMQTLISLRDNAMGAIRSAIDSVRGALLSPEMALPGLREAFRGAGSPEARSQAAIALAGGLQGRFSQAQALASQGAITGEELARVQSEVLAELEDTGAQTMSEFERLISAQQSVIDAANQQIEILQAGFDAFVESINSTKDLLKDKLDRQLFALADIRSALDGRRTSIGDFLRSYNENRGNVRGRVG